MRWFRTSIAGLLVAVALVGVAIAALIHPSPIVGNAAFSAILATLTIAVLTAVYRRGRARAFWVGFATCGWACFLAIYGPGMYSLIGQDLVITAILDIAYPYTVPTTGPATTFGPAGVMPPTPFPGAWEVWTRPDRVTQYNMVDPSKEPFAVSPKMFRRIGYALSCLMSALIGGVLTRRFHATRDPKRPTPD